MLAGEWNKARIGTYYYNAHLVYPNAISFLIEGQVAKRALIGKTPKQTALHHMFYRATNFNDLEVLGRQRNLRYMAGITVTGL